MYYKYNIIVYNIIVLYVYNIMYIILCIWGAFSLVNTSLFILNLKFCPNSLRMTPESETP